MLKSIPHIRLRWRPCSHLSEVLEKEGAPAKTKQTGSNRKPARKKQTRD